MGYKLRRSMTAYLMLLPTILLVAVFTLYPIIDSFVISFYNWDMMSSTKEFVGFGNYVYILKDPLFHTALVNTMLYVISFVPISLILGLVLAVLLNTKIRFMPLYRTAFFIPYITSLAATGIVWNWIFNEQFGLLNYFLHFVGVNPIDWLNNPHWTLFNMVMLGVWHQLGYIAVIFLAGLQGISREYYEAADVDGASRWRKFVTITLPLLSPTFYFLLIITTIEACKVFMQVYVLYGGSSGPNDSGVTLVYYMFLKGFSDFKMGYASAAAYILFLITFVCTLLQMTLSRRVHYEG